jgi:IS30 family transposase
MKLKLYQKLFKKRKFRYPRIKRRRQTIANARNLLKNDIAFAQFENMQSEMKTQIYFCEPYKSYQKGGIENANRLLRTKLPLQTNIDRFE